jgi:hypothetical protein
LSALGTGCRRDEPACAAKIASMAGAALAVTGDADAAVDGDDVKLVAVDAASGRERGSASFHLPKKGDASRASACKLLVVRLLAPDRERGTIEVHTLAGASIVIDKQGAVTAPAPPFKVLPGRHVVYVALAGYESVTHTVDVAFEGRASVDVKLEHTGEGGGGGVTVSFPTRDDGAAPDDGADDNTVVNADDGVDGFETVLPRSDAKPKRAGPPWLAWSLGGVGAFALVAGAAFTVWNASAYATADAHALSSVNGVEIDGRTMNTDIAVVRTSFVAMSVAYGTAVVAGAGAVVSALVMSGAE